MSSGWKTRLYDLSPHWLQNALISAEVESRHRWLDSPEFRSLCDEVLSSEELPPDEVQALQDERLGAMVRHAYEAVPYYREVMDERGLKPRDVQSVSDLPKLPVLTKDIARSRERDLIAQGADLRKAEYQGTSGTTGTPFHLWVDRRSLWLDYALIRRHRIWAGVHFDRPLASFGGKIVVPIGRRKPPFWRVVRPRGDYIEIPPMIVYSAFHLAEDVIDLYLDHMRQQGIDQIKGYPSNLLILARHILKRNTTFPVRTVLTGSEPLYDHMRAAIESAFECRVCDWYGNTEKTAYGCQCDRYGQYHLGGHLNVMEFGTVEGSEGGSQIIGTSLTNFCQPMIRHATGDIALRVFEPCPCGRSLPLMTQVQEKVEDILLLRDGRMISPSVLTHPFKPLHGIEASQIVQEDLDTIRVLLATGPAYTEDQEQRLLAAFRERLGADVRVVIEHVSDLVAEPGRKFRWVVSKVSPLSLPEEVSCRRNTQG
ncbi:MAG: phenylacetate--CoA ligase family protein [Armatimonadota bacterium]|nr:MAG: phenylacetate--CoA ligase family protein [Armatimonadota bacterium]